MTSNVHKQTLQLFLWAPLTTESAREIINRLVDSELNSRSHVQSRHEDLSVDSWTRRTQLLEGPLLSMVPTRRVVVSIYVHLMSYSLTKTLACSCLFINKVETFIHSFFVCLKLYNKTLVFQSINKLNNLRRDKCRFA